MTILLSIIIPTRNRAKYAVSAINSILKIDSTKFELIIQDNSDNDELEDYLRMNVVDSRIRYSHTKSKLDVIANFNSAIKLSSGEYFTFIGDDDGINPEIVEAVEWMKENDFDALTPYNLADYMWPDIRMKYYNDKFSGILRLRKFTGKYTPVDVEVGMRESAKNAFQNLVFAVNLPKVYYGVVRRSCIDKVFESSNTYFPGVSPDMSGAMAVASFVKNAIAVDYPLFVPGSSAKSTAGLGAQKKHFGRLEDQEHLPNGCWNNWPYNVPKYFAVQTVWAQSGLSSLNATGRDDVIKYYNLPLLYAMCMVFNPQFLTTTISHYVKTLRTDNKNIAIGLFFLIKLYFATWFMRTRSMAERIKSKVKPSIVLTLTDVENIEDAVDGLKNHLTSKKIKFKDLISNQNQLPSV